MLYCSMNDLLKTLNITYHDLKPGSDASFNAFIYLLILSRSISDHHLRCGVGG